MFSVGYRDVQAIVLGLTGSDDGQLVLHRFKYLQRMSFPEGANAGRGRRAEFRLDQLLQIVVAFELIQTGMAPARAIRVLGTNWPDLRRPLALGWICARKPVFAPLRELLVMNAGGFQDASADNVGGPVRSPFRPMPAADFLSWMSPDGKGATRLVLDPVRLVANLLIAAGDTLADAEVEELEIAFVQLWLDQFDGFPPDVWLARQMQSGALGAVER